MIEINMKIEIRESRTPTVETLSMISLEVDLLNIYYKIFNNTAIIYIGILQYLIVHRPTWYIEESELPPVIFPRLRPR